MLISNIASIDLLNATQSIQSILAPAIMISSCGLLLLGLNNRYSSVINRLRLLNNKRRGLTEKLINNKQFDYQENVRLKSVQKQLDRLLQRCMLVRNAIISIMTSIGLFVLTSLFIAIGFFTDTVIFQSISLIIFIFGMFLVFLGVVFSGFEVVLAFKIVLIEVKAEE